MASSSKTIIDVVVEDHREVEELFQRAESTSDPEERHNLANQIIAAARRSGPATFFLGMGVIFAVFIALMTTLLLIAD